MPVERAQGGKMKCCWMLCKKQRSFPVQKIDRSEGEI